MNTDPKYLINGHLDRCLSSAEQAALTGWINQSPENAKRFALAVMLHDRIHVQYQSLKLISEQLDNTRVAASPRRRYSHQWSIAASVVCLLMAAFVYQQTFSIPNSSAKAIAGFHDLVAESRKPGDRSYHIAFVVDKSDEVDPTGKNGPLVKENSAINDEAMLYVRDGRQFVYQWQTVNGTSIVGSNGQTSWSIRDNAVVENGNPLHFTGPLPGGKYLTPILSLFDGQEKQIVADYNLDLRKQTGTTRLFIAVKKPDTIQGPRRIEITYEASSNQISKIRIWPETPDHRKNNFTLIELASQDLLHPDWFSPNFHVRPGKVPATDATGAAD